jgi:outer membrane receptor for ferrienterochelin and colicins
VARMGQRSRAVLGALVAAALWSGQAWAQSSSVSLDLAAEADLNFELGIEAYRRSDFREALAYLMASNRLGPNRNVMYNIARCFEQLGQFDQAFRYYTDYIALETDPAARAEAERAVERIRPQLALLRVESEPAGATIAIDRADLGTRGVAPLTIAVAPGPHRVILTLEGYEPAEQGEIEAVQGTTVEARLALARIVGRVEVDGEPAGAAVRVDTEESEPLGRLPATLELAPGPHVLIVAQPGRVTAQRVVTIRAGETQRLRVVLDEQIGSLVINCEDRDAHVEVDGRPVGVTPLTVPDLAVGTHRVRVTMPGMVPYEREVEVRVNQPTTLDVELELAREVTAASRQAEEVEDAPASVTLIGQEELRAFGAETIYEALAGVRGVFQTNDRMYEYLGFRGFARPGNYSNRVLVTLDGHTMNEDQLGQAFVGYDQRVDLLDVERIEVVRGPGSVLYGSNAFFGVVNLVTREGDAVRRPHLSIAADSVRQLRARIGGGTTFRNGGFWLSAGGLASQGEDLYFPELDAPVVVEGDDGELVVGGTDGEARRLDGQRAVNGAGRLWLGDFTLELAYNLRDRNYPTAAFDTLFGDERAKVQDRRGFVELRYEPTIRDILDLQVRAYADFTQFIGNWPYAVENGGLSTDTWDGVSVGGEVRGTVRLRPWDLRITAGAEVVAHVLGHLYGENEVDPEPYLDERPLSQTFSIYAQAAATPVRWFSFHLGGRFDYFNLPDFPTESLWAVSPRLALLFRPTSDDTLKLMGGTAFRAPSPYEFFYNDGGVTQLLPEGLQPEHIYSGEIEYVHRFTAELSLLGSVYFNHIESLIEAVPVPENEDVFWYANSDRPIQTLGAEVELRREWRRGWMVAASYSFQRSRFETVGSTAEADRVTNSPEHLFAVRGAVPLVRNFATLATRLRVESPRYTEELTDATATKTAVLWDLFLTGVVPQAHLEYGIGVRNLLDWEYGHPATELAMLAVPQPGRTFYATATLTW